jgi:magnesium chelatase family protein
MSCSRLNHEQQAMVQQWSSKHNWSARVQMKILRLARTISDLSGDESITNEAIWEAVTMRRSQASRNNKGMVK